MPNLHTLIDTTLNYTSRGCARVFLQNLWVTIITHSKVSWALTAFQNTFLKIWIIKKISFKSNTPHSQSTHIEKRKMLNQSIKMALFKWPQWRRGKCWITPFYKSNLKYTFFQIFRSPFWFIAKITRKFWKITLHTNYPFNYNLILILSKSTEKLQYYNII